MHFLRSIVIWLWLAVLYAGTAAAQCPMCKGIVESSAREGSTAAAGFNVGIMYLFVMPYLLVGVIGYFWYRARKQAAGDRR